MKKTILVISLFLVFEKCFSQREPLELNESYLFDSLIHISLNDTVQITKNFEMDHTTQFNFKRYYSLQNGIHLTPSKYEGEIHYPALFIVQSMYSFPNTSEIFCLVQDINTKSSFYVGLSKAIIDENILLRNSNTFNNYKMFTSYLKKESNINESVYKAYCNYFNSTGYNQLNEFEDRKRKLKCVNQCDSLKNSYLPVENYLFFTSKFIDKYDFNKKRFPIINLVDKMSFNEMKLGNGVAYPNLIFNNIADTNFLYVSEDIAEKIVNNNNNEETSDNRLVYLIYKFELKDSYFGKGISTFNQKAFVSKVYFFFDKDYKIKIGSFTVNELK